uniref:RNI-like superfamily protein n=1 Tax=Chenopodium quinoa TaxID=63459 RepID=A0A803LY84_CHEQI
MEEHQAPATAIAASLQNLALDSSATAAAPFLFPVPPLKRTKPPSLVSLCIAVIGKHLEDLIPELGEIAIGFPAHIKKDLAEKVLKTLDKVYEIVAHLYSLNVKDASESSYVEEKRKDFGNSGNQSNSKKPKSRNFSEKVARRKKLLNDEVIISLADGTWEILDVSCSDVSDFGLAKVAEMCPNLRAVNIRGCPRSDYTARRSLHLFKPDLNNLEGDSWEELDTAEFTHGGQSLRWLVWPNIDPDSLKNFSSECPRVMVNPKPSPFDFKEVAVPREALPNTVLDEHAVEDIDPTIWVSCRPTRRILPIISNPIPIISNPSELSMAEKFRLAFVERDTRLAPKRAKNARQHQRRAEREWMMTSEAKAISHASRANKSRGRS